MSILWDLIQQQQISNLQKKTDDVKGTTTNQEITVRELDSRLNRLLLITQAMWELQRERFTLSEAELNEKVQEIDLRDGSIDGKNNSGRTCTSCHRILNKKHVQCIYCGAEREERSPFDSL